VAETPTAAHPVAVVGLACRFPDASDPAALLDLVLTRRRAFRRLPTCRVDVADYYSPDPSTPDATYSTRAGVLEGWQFDRAAFGIGPAEYQAADPAHWLALETATRALATAGWPGGNGLARSRVGVIIGNTLTGDVSRASALRLRWPFVRNVLADALIASGVPREQGMPVLRHAAARYLSPFPEVSAGTRSGSLPASIAGRICGYFGFQGGAHAVDGASSSSLVAVMSACAALAAGDLDVALAGGVDVSLDPFELIGMAKTGVLAAGDMRVYDANPTGFLPGEGCGVVVLMRAADARATGQPILAEIAGWGMSSAGRPGLTASDPGSQLLALRRAYDRAGIDPADVQLIEGHGAGTAADDFAELTALAELRRGAQQTAALGSVKANIGHAQAAAGAAGLIKTVLAMGSDLIPPVTGASTPHPLLLGGQAALHLPDRAQPWPEGPRIAAVSAMDPDGANVHLVLASEPVRGTRPERAFRVMARGARPGPADGPRPGPGGSGPGAASGQATQTAVYLLQAGDRATLATGLARIADIAPWMADAELHDLACQLAGEAADPGQIRVAIVASRQEQLARLAREAITMLPGLATSWFAARPGIFAADGPPGQVTLLLPDGTVPAGPAGPPPAVGTEPSALAWLDQLGVRAATAMGHGLGEIAALAWAESLPEADAGRLARRCAEILAQPEIAPAGTGDRTAQLRMLLTQFVFAPPRRRLVSAATGRPVTSPADIAEALCAQLTGPGRLEEALLEAAADADLLVETGPGQALSAAAAQCCDVPAVSLGTGGGRAGSRAVAALFAVGALGHPQSLYAGEPARPIDIWRERIFITSPCQQLPPRPAGVQPVPAPAHPAEPPAAPPSTAPPSTAGMGAGRNAAGAPPVETSAPVAPARPAAAERPAAVPAAGAGRGREDRSGFPPGASRIPGPGPTAGAQAAGAAGQVGTATGPADGTGADDPGADDPRASDPRADDPGADDLGADDPGVQRQRRTPAPVVVRGFGPARQGMVRTGGTPEVARPPVPAAATEIPANTQPPGGAQFPGGTLSAGDGQFAGDTQTTGDTQPPDPVAGVAVWTRCYAEELRAPRQAPGLAEDRPWRIRSAANHPFGINAGELARDEPGADRTLAILGGPADPGACAAALTAASDGARTGQLVVISPGAGFTGFWASLHAEHPSMGITLLRSRSGPDGLRAALRYAAVTPGQFRELSIDPAGQPREPVMVPVTVPGGGTFPLGPSDVVLVSRGTQGAGLALAQVLACCGAPVAIIGKPGANEDSRLMSGLERLSSAGARVIFETVDVANTAELAAAMHRIQRRLGPVTAVGHAAPAGPPRLATELTEGEIAEHVSAGTAGLARLLGCIRTDRLRLIATFGSVAGRYGLAGESLLALASGSLAEQAERLSDAIPGCRALHIDWPGWAGSGLGERPGLAAGLARARITALPVREGSRLLLKMLATPDLPSRIAVHGRIGEATPPPIAAAGPAQQPGGRFLGNLRVNYPGVELVADAALSTATDPYLAEYRVDGRAVLPAALALEAMAQAATALAGRPVRHAKGVCAVAPVTVPDDLPGTVIRICALRDGDTVWTAVRCADSGFDVDHYRAAFYCGDTVSPVVPVTAEPGGRPGLDGADEPATHVGSAQIIDGTELYGQTCFQSGRFRRVAFLPEVSSAGCRALASGGDDQQWFSLPGQPGDGPLVLGNPGLNDATIHVLQACVPHRRLVVAGCESVTFSGRETGGVAEIRAVAISAAGKRAADGGPPVAAPARALPDGGPPAGGVRAVAQAEAPAGPAAPSSPQPVPQQRSSGPRAAGPPTDYSWDVDAVDLAGNLLVSWRGLRFRDAGPLPRTEPWPPLLLSVYLERCAAALGLDSRLQVRIQCGQPEPAPDGGPEAIALSVGPAPLATGSWQAADPGAADPVTGPGLAGLRHRLAQRLDEPLGLVNARIRAIAACLPAAEQLADEITIDESVSADWLVLHAGGTSLACTAVDVSGVALPVVIALATGIPAEDGPVPEQDRGQQSASEQAGPSGAEPGRAEAAGAGPAGAGPAGAGPAGAEIAGAEIAGAGAAGTAEAGPAPAAAGLPWVWLQADQPAETPA
jgi:enediyne polyketide synthase